MYNIKRHLLRQSQHLLQICRDLAAAETTSNPFDSYYPENKWELEIAASHSLGEGIALPRWKLFEYLLSTWVAWRELEHNWRLYYGQQDIDIPRWNRTRTRCEHYRMIFRGFGTSYRERIIDSWLQEDISISETDPVRSLFHLLIDQDQKLQLCDLFVTPLSDTTVQALSPYTPNYREMLQPRDDEIYQSIQALSLRQFDNVKNHLLAYRHSTLKLSWLKNDSHESALTRFYSDIDQEIYPMNDLRPIINILEEKGLYRPGAQILQRLGQAIGEIGYGNLVEDILDSDFSPDQNSPVGSSEINVIPSDQSADCKPALLAISQGNNKRSKLGFPNIMQQTKTHLIQCANTTRLVIFLCDVWDSKTFEQDHFQELQAWNQKGVEFVFLLAGVPDRVISHIQVDFS